MSLIKRLLRDKTRVCKSETEPMFWCRFVSPEFIPPRQRTNPLKFFLERKDMIQRRKVLNIPEFYVGKKQFRWSFWLLSCVVDERRLIVTCLSSGSTLSVTTSDPYAANNTKRFVGICIQRSGKGLGATFILRNIVDGQGELLIRGWRCVLRYLSQVWLCFSFTCPKSECDITPSFSAYNFTNCLDSVTVSQTLAKLASYLALH